MHNGRKVSATVAYLLFFAALAILLSLGGWQWRRGIEKTAVEAQLAHGDSITLARAPADWRTVAWRRARLQGAWVAGADFLLANRIHRGRPGFEVFSAFRLAGDGAALLINRGWVAADVGDGTGDGAAAATVDKTSTVSGRIYLPQKGFTLGPAHDPAAVRPGGRAVFQYVDTVAMSAAFGGELQPAVVALDARHPAAFTPLWRPTTVPAARHYGYAVQWWGLAATLLVFGVVWYRRGRRHRRGGEPSPASSSAITVITEPPMNRGRLKLALVFAAFLGPLLAAFAWYYGFPGGAAATRATTNHAPLIAPPSALRAFANPALESGAPFHLDALKRKWHIVHLLPAACAAGCRQALYNTRQARLALGRDAARVQRILLGERAQLESLAAEHPDSIRLLRAENGLENQLAPIRLRRNLDTADALLIDPLGNVMLAIPAALDPRLLLKDLKKLMKLSRIG